MEPKKDRQNSSPQLARSRTCRVLSPIPAAVAATGRAPPKLSAKLELLPEIALVVSMAPAQAPRPPPKLLASNQLCLLLGRLFHLYYFFQAHA